MKVFKNNTDGDILIMYARNRYKWLSNPIIKEGELWDEVWDGNMLRAFTRINTRYYYEQILL